MKKKIQKMKKNHFFEKKFQKNFKKISKKIKKKSKKWLQPSFLTYINITIFYQYMENM